jgi:molybdate transport system substrate-binding protein
MLPLHPAPGLGRLRLMFLRSLQRTVFRALATLVLALPLPVVPPAAAAADDAPLVAAASDLQFALNDIAAMFRRDTSRSVRIVYGSSGNFRRQIAEGGPFELFLSADEAYVMALAKEGYTVDDGVPYAIGRLVLVVPEGSELKLDPTLRDVAAAVAEGRLRKFAIANPEHAPYGRAAQEALSAAGVWEAVRAHLVLGENIAQAAQFATSGSAQGGIVALSLALAPGVLADARYVAVPDAMHKPLVQRMVLTKRARETAREFYRYLQQPAARAVFRRYGFTAPGE